MCKRDVETESKQSTHAKTITWTWTQYHVDAYFERFNIYDNDNKQTTFYQNKT